MAKLYIKEVITSILTLKGNEVECQEEAVSVGTKKHNQVFDIIETLTCFQHNYFNQESC